MYFNVHMFQDDFFSLFLEVMASLSSCSTCEKGVGTCFCPLCQSYFCDDDFRDHRGMLVNKLVGLTVDRDSIQEKINKAGSNKQSGSSLLAQIDQWQQVTIAKVKQAAEEARQQVNKVMNSKLEKIVQEFQVLTQELKKLTETKGILEQNLTSLKRQIDQLNQNLEQLSRPPAVELNMNRSEQIMWHQMIYVEEKAMNAGRKEPQFQVIGKCLNRI